MDEDKDLETPETLEPENEESDSEDTPPVSDTDDKDKLIADLTEKNAQLFARAKKAEGKGHKIETPEVKPQTVPQIDVDAIIAQKFEERDLESLEFSDDLKAETKAYAKAKGISVRAAAETPVIKFLIDQEVSKQREQEASASTKGAGKTAKRDFSALSDDDILKLDDEGLAKYNEWLRTQ